jgi:Cys-rich protein (TIGR01571 family)
LKDIHFVAMSRSGAAAIVGMLLLCWASVLLLFGSENNFLRRLDSESEPTPAPSEDNESEKRPKRLRSGQRESTLSDADDNQVVHHQNGKSDSSFLVSISDEDNNRTKLHHWHFSKHQHFNFSKHMTNMMLHQEEELTILRRLTLGVPLLHVIILITFACVYKYQVVNSIPKLEQRPVNALQDLPHGLCDCWSHCSLCAHLFFCGVCRAAHTWHVAQVCEYWPSVCLFCIAGSSKIICVDVCIFTYFRTKVKERLGIKPNPAMDCLCHLFCAPCAIGQEAMAVDEELGVKVECCCRLTGAVQGRMPTEASLITDAVIVK